MVARTGEYFHAQRDTVGQRYQPYSYGAEPNQGAYPLVGGMAEVKAALVTLAQAGADPLKNPDPITETTWRSIVPASPFWDGPTADEFAAFVGRYRSPAAAAPPMQMGPSGPQPTIAGLSLLGSLVPLPRYTAWRAGAPSDGTSVIPVPLELTDGALCNPMLDLSQGTDPKLADAWNALATPQSEASRAAILAMIAQLRTAIRDSHGCGVPTPDACTTAGLYWDPISRACVAQKPAVSGQFRIDCQNAGGIWDDTTWKCVTPGKPGTPESPGAAGRSIVPAVALAGAATLLVAWAVRTHKGASPFGR